MLPAPDRHLVLQTLTRGSAIHCRGRARFAVGTILSTAAMRRAQTLFAGVLGSFVSGLEFGIHLGLDPRLELVGSQFGIGLEFDLGLH